MKFTLENRTPELDAFVGKMAASDYPHNPEGCDYIAGRDAGGKLLAAAAYKKHGGTVEIVGMNFQGQADQIAEGFKALEWKVKLIGVKRIEFAAETNAMCEMAERLGLRSRAVFYVKDL